MVVKAAKEGTSIGTPNCSDSSWHRPEAIPSPAVGNSSIRKKLATGSVIAKLPRQSPVERPVGMAEPIIVCTRAAVYRKKREAVR